MTHGNLTKMACINSNLLPKTKCSWILNSYVNSNKTDYTELYQWKKALASLLDQCFTRLHPQ